VTFATPRGLWRKPGSDGRSLSASQKIGTAHGAEKFGSGELSKFRKESFGDAAQSRRQVCREGRPVRRRHADEAARQEIAPAFVFLAAPSCSSYITGEILPIIGGYSGG